MLTRPLIRLLTCEKLVTASNGFKDMAVGASMFWSRMTLRGLEFAVFYDFYRRQR
jgi:hypothetical protein